MTAEALSGDFGNRPHRLVASGGQHAAPCPITLPGSLRRLTPLGLELDTTARDELRRRYDTARDAETRTRFQMVLLAGAGWPAVAVAALVRRSPDTVWRVVRRYQQGGPEGVPHRPRPGHRGRIPAAWEQELRRVIELDPHAVGVASAVWTTRLLAASLATATGHRVHLGTVRRHLHQAGYVCKRPGWTLKRKAEEDPEWAGNG